MNYRITYNNGEPTIERKVKKSILGIPYSGWEVSMTGRLQDAAQAFKDNLFPKKFDTKKHIEVAFVFEGVTYYHIPDMTHMSPMRYAVALTYMKESSMRCDRTHLEGFIKATYDNINTSTGSINLVNIVTLLKDLKERLEFAYVPDLVYKEASVVYFDETESPEDYDWEYNRKKIEKWKAAGADFFLQTLAKDLVLSDVISQENSATYMMTLEMMDKQSVKNLLDSLPANMSKEQSQNFSELRMRAGLE